MMDLQRWSKAIVALMVTVLVGCNASMPNLGSKGIQVGPNSSYSGGLGESKKKSYNYSSDIFLDVAIPVFDPGFATTRTGDIDYAKVESDQIWPQLRRAEAKKFAVQAKRSLDKTKSFGSVSVTPTPNTTADIFLFGKIIHSDSEIVKIKIRVLDSSGKEWGDKEFKHTVSEGFFRDASNTGKDPYEPIFTDISNYVYDLLARKTDLQKQNIKNITKVSYAKHYSPEAFDQYLKIKRSFTGNDFYMLTGLPSESDRMVQRISMLNQQEQMFVNRLQNQYAAFDKTTNKHYREWQKETLPEAAQKRRLKTERNTKAALGLILATGAVLTGKNGNSAASAAGTVIAAGGAAALIKSAIETNEEVKVYKATLDEMGENLDLSISPSVMTFNKERVKLTGTASEQYNQWKAHLKKVHDLESGNLQQL